VPGALNHPEGKAMPQLTTTRVPDGFSEATAAANGITMNYVCGGTGPTLVLLHGYPQTWYMWRKLLPAMAEHFTVIAPDLRGAGGSDAPTDGYTKSGLAADVHDLLVGLGLAEQVSVVGHDIGTMVAYAYAAAHRDSISRLVLIDAPLADETLYQLPSITPQGPGFWNFGFFTLQNGLPERMLAGREDTWVDGFVDWLEVVKGGVDEQAIAEYAAQLRLPGHTRGSFEYFRAMDADVAETIHQRDKPLTMPVLAIGAEGTFGQKIYDQVVNYATNVTGDIAPTGHWVAEEDPAYLTARLLDFLSDDHASPDAHDAMATA
jgi:pimeloyl-ACP methyl ester carboxylesterase